MNDKEEEEGNHENENAEWERSTDNQGQDVVVDQLDIMPSSSNWIIDLEECGAHPEESTPLMMTVLDSFGRCGRVTDATKRWHAPLWVSCYYLVSYYNQPKEDKLTMIGAPTWARKKQLTLSWLGW